MCQRFLLPPLASAPCHCAVVCSFMTPLTPVHWFSMGHPANHCVPYSLLSLCPIVLPSTGLVTEEAFDGHVLYK